MISVHALDVGGAEKMLVNIVNGLERKQFRCTVISLGLHNPLQFALADGAAAVKVAARRWRYDLNPALQIRHLIQECSADCVVCFDFYTFFFTRLALLGYGRFAPKVFISQHTTIHRTRKEHWQNWLYTRFLRKDDRLLTVCHYQADYLSRAYCIPDKQFVTIHNGVDIEFFSKDQVKERSEIIRKRLGVPCDAKVILHVSNFSPTKRHEDMLAALQILQASNPELKLFYISVGGGFPERESLIKDLADKMGLRVRILFAGVQNDVRPYYKIAACACLASVSETFSISALEAMSMGIPVVLTKVGGADEMVVDGFNGLLVAPRRPDLLAKALALVLGKRERFNDNALRLHVIENFSIRKCVQNHARLLERAI